MSAAANILPSWLRDALPASARSDDKVRWVRQQMRLFANAMALEEIYQLGPLDYNDAPAQVMLSCVGLAKRVGYGGSVGWTAYLAEWPEAKERARHYADTLRKAIWSLGRDQATGAEIMARARVVNKTQKERFGIDLSSDELMHVVRTIAFTAAAGYRTNGRRR